MPKHCKIHSATIKLIDRYKFNSIDQYLSRQFIAKSKTESKHTILVQCSEDYYYFSLFAEIAKQLERNHNFVTEQLVLRSLRPDSSLSLTYFIKSRLVFNRFTDNRWVKLYSSFCDKIAFRSDAAFKLSDIPLFHKAYKIWRSIESKEDLVKLNIDGIHVGDLINDSYLRYKPAPTVDIKNSYLLIVIWQCLRTLSQSQVYFSIHKPTLF